MAAVFWLSVFGIAYVYAGYPLLLFGLSRLRRPPVWHSDWTPTVTLLIAAYEEEHSITHRLENALALDYPLDRLQILVAADGSGDTTAERVRDFSDRGVELSFVPERIGKMAAIERAMEKARGEIVVFSDANNAYGVDALRKLVAPFADPAVGGVAGAKHIARGDGALGDSEGLYWRYESAIRQWETRLGSCIGAPGEIFAIRCELFQAPPRTIINDDFYLAMRLLRRGHRVVYEPAACSTERVSPTAADEIARRRRINSGRFQALLHAADLLPLGDPLLLWQTISHKFARTLLPLLMISALVANLGLALGTAAGVEGRASAGGLDRFLGVRGEWAWIFLFGQGAVYLSAAIGAQLQDSGRLGKLLYLPRFLVLSNWAALLGLLGYLRQGPSALWERAPRREGP